MADGCWVVVFMVFVLPALAAAYQRWEKDQAAAAERRAAAEAKAADEKFLREHPEAWAARERAKLEREALDARKKYADEESNRENAGALAGIVWRFFGR